MFGKILYISDNIAVIANNLSSNSVTDLMNLHLIFESGEQRVLGEILEVKATEIHVKFLGEFINGRYNNGLIRKPSLNSKIRIISQQELLELVGQDTEESVLLGKSAVYKDYYVYPRVNDLLAHHMCIFGGTGSGKSCGVARIIQNVMGSKKYLPYNANLIFFDSFGEYKNAFKDINQINPRYKYKFVTSQIKDSTDVFINIPMNLLKIDDIAILLRAEKPSQLTIIERALKLAKYFATKTPSSHKYKNQIIARALMNIIYSSMTIEKKRDSLFNLLSICHTPELNSDIEIQGVGYTRSFHECFQIDSKGQFSETVIAIEYITSFLQENLELEEVEDAVFTLNDYYNALEFSMISDGFQNNSELNNDAQLLKVRLYSLIHSFVGNLFTGTKHYTPGEFISELVTLKGEKAQIININLEGIDDNISKAIVKIYSRLIFDFAKDNASIGTVPFHLFLEEAHRYVQKDIDVFLIGYNIFERIAKEGRKYGVMLDIISQRPVEISDTVVSQCSNFLIFKMTHPMDVKYIEEMIPNISEDVIQKMKSLQPGTCVAFGSAFKIPMIVRLEMPNPSPYSSSCDVTSYWNSDELTNKVLKLDGYAKKLDTVQDKPAINPDISSTTNRFFSQNN